ncbi:MAG TPA: phosphatase PAP2 family protein [Bryobacteraceae bacterium]
MTTPSSAIAFPAAAKKHALEALYRWIQAACAALLLGLAAALFGLGSSHYIAFAFAGAFLVHVAMRPSRREVALTVACAVIFGLAYHLLCADMSSYYGAAVAIPGAFLGLGSLLVVTLRRLWAADAAKRLRLEQAREVFLIPVLCVCSTAALSVARAFTPITYDRLVYAFDLKFGGPPSWAIGQLLRSHPWMLQTCGYAYYSLPLGLAAFVALHGKDRQLGTRITVDLRLLCVALGLVGFLLYQVCPVAGPIYLFGNAFPSRVPDLAGFAIQPAWLAPADRNGMPSLHVGWMLLLFWNVRRRSWWMGAIAAIDLVLTAVATLGFGEHYLMDLIVAPALALAMQAACTRTGSAVRWAALATGTAITLAWLMAFRTGVALRIPAGAAAWSMALVSVALPVFAAWRLERAADRSA